VGELFPAARHQAWLRKQPEVRRTLARTDVTPGGLAIQQRVVHMATQPAPSYDQMTGAAVVPAVRPRLIPRKTTTPPRFHPGTRKDVNQVPEQQRLLLEMLPLVRRMAFKIRERLPAHVEVDDLLANGVLGLVDAIAKFDSSKRVKLESYARHRVRGGILDGLRAADPASRDMRRKNKRILQLYRELEVKLGRPVADEEIAAALGMSLSQWYRTLNEAQGLAFGFGGRSISAGPTSKRPCTEPALLADHGADPFELCYRREQREVLRRALSHLRERERRIIVLYYQQELTMKQIADRLNVDESRVSQLHSAALVRLRACAESLLRRRRAIPSAAAASIGMTAGNGA
jgi:RNA polymerase sigma factor for flagellar operon FliA